MADPSANIPLGAGKSDGDKAGGPATSFVNNIVEGAKKEFGDTLQKNMEKNAKNKELKKAG